MSSQEEALKYSVMVDVAIVGAGMAGLICAQWLQQAGYRVIVVEKSRGLGGRVATRRLAGTWADHGARYLEVQGDLSEHFIQALCQQDILHQWIDTIHQLEPSGNLFPSIASPITNAPRYAAATGITAIAKFLGRGLEVWHRQRVHAIAPQANQTWLLTAEPDEVDPIPPLAARAVVMAIPAPQALSLLPPLANQGLPLEFLTALHSVDFDPCLTAIAAYSSVQHSTFSQLPWKAISCSDDPDLAWISIDSSKQFNSTLPVMIVQSTAIFARQYLDASDLQPAGQHLIKRAARSLALPFDAPDLLQVHRWRYAFARQPLSDPCLATASPLPLVCAGDWCGGKTIEAALRSGMSAAAQVAQFLQSSRLPEIERVADLANILNQIGAED